MADQVRINGNLYGFASTSFKIAGERYFGITEISYGDSRERVKGWGMARHHAPMGKSPGKYNTEPVKVKGYLHSLEAIRVALAAQAEDEISYGNTESEVVVQYQEPGLGVGHVQIERCHISKDVTSVTESADPLMGELELDCMLIRRNGKTLFDSTQDQP